MQRTAHFFQSILIAALFSFFLPLLLIGGLYIGLVGLQQISALSAHISQGAPQLLHFLAVFGSGHPCQGALVIALASSTVGILFDTFALYRHQSFSHH